MFMHRYIEKWNNNNNILLLSHLSLFVLSPLDFSWPIGWSMEDIKICFLKGTATVWIDVGYIY